MSKPKTPVILSVGRLCRLLYAFVGVFALSLAACSGGFSSGTASPSNILPPNGPQSVASSGTSNTTSAARPTGPGALNSTGATPPPGDVGAYPFSQAPQGLQCPEVQGFTCILQFNVTAVGTQSKKKTLGSSHGAATSTPVPTQSPSSSPSASPSPSPMPTGSGAANSPQTGASASPTPAPTPTGPMILVQLAALPTDAPAMTTSDSKAPATQALLTLRLHTDGNVKLSGSTIAQFTLPAAQVTKGRGFAIQLFHETLKRRNSRTDQFIGSYTSSTLSGNTLRFAFTPPSVTIKKDELWLLVLYGDAIATPAPSASPTGSSSPATNAPSAASSPNTTPTP